MVFDIRIIYLFFCICKSKKKCDNEFAKFKCESDILPTVFFVYDIFVNNSFG